MSGYWKKVIFVQQEGTGRMLAETSGVRYIGIGGTPRSALHDLARQTGGRVDTVNGLIMFNRPARSASTRLDEFRKYFLTLAR